MNGSDGSRKRPHIYFMDHIILIVFIGMFPIDASWYLLGIIADVPKLPLGFLCGAISVLIVFPYLLINSGKFVLNASIVFMLYLSCILAILQSPLFDFDWAPLFAWYLAMFVSGFALGRSPILQRRFAQLLLVAATLSCSFICIAALQGGWTPESGFNYLRPACALMISGLFALILVNRKLTMAAIYFSVLAALAFLSSRTFFYLWLLVPILASIVPFMGRSASHSARNLVWVLGPIAIAAGAAFAWIVVVPVFAEIGHARIAPEIQVFGGDGRPTSVDVADGSINTRLELMLLGWEQIVENPLFGFYKGYTVYGGEGGYIHNILSYWHQYGLVAFIILILLLFRAFRHLLRLSKGKTATIAKLLFICVCLAAVAARSHASTEMFFAIGFALGVSPTTTRRATQFQRAKSHNV